jgi:predicted outer membrane repeat protein
MQKNFLQFNFSKKSWLQAGFFAALFFATTLTAQAATITVNATSDNASGGNCELRDAINASNSNSVVDACTAGSGTDTIVFSGSGTITLTSDLPTITAAVNIDGGDDIIISGNALYRIFNVNISTATIAIDNIDLINGFDTAGGCMYVSPGATVNLTDVLFDGCDATDDGAGIYGEDSGGSQTTFNFTDVTMNNNVTGTGGFRGGGAIYVGNNNRLIATNFNASGNATGSGDGAVVYSDSYSGTPLIDIDGGTFANNTTDEHGAVFISRGTGHIINNVTFDTNICGDNVTTCFGSAITVGSGTVTVTGSTFIDNVVDATGSAGYGGAIAAFGGNLNVDDSTFDGNSAYHGGAIYITSGFDVVVTDSTFIDNTSNVGAGAIYVDSGGGDLDVSGSAFINNSTGQYGGAIRIDNGTLDLINNTFDSNDADYGGALITIGGTNTVYNNTFTNNTATTAGGGYYVDNNSTSWANNIFEGNTAPTGPNCTEDAAGDSDSAGFNLIAVATGCPTTGSDITGSSANLGALATNGGTTLNRLPGGGSPVINAASATFAPATDQRGIARPIGIADDIGSIEVGGDLTAPVIAEVTPVPTPTNDTTPNYTFSTDEDGTITYGGDCSSATTAATVGNNTVTFNTLSAGAHTNCTITVTDAATNASTPLSVTSFTISPPSSPRGRILFQNDDFAQVFSDNLVINSDDEATGDISIKFGNTIAQTLSWDVSDSKFNLSSSLDLNSNQLTSFRAENVAALPGGGGGLGSGGTGRLVMLTSTDSTAPGCTVTSCTAGIYSWTGSTWLPLFKGALGGNNNDVQYNDSGANGGEDAFEYDATNNQLTVPGIGITEDVAFTGDISPAQLTADQNDYNPTGLATASTIRLTGDNSFRTITGLAGGSDGRVIMLHNIGTSAILLANQNAGSAAANRFELGGGDIPLFPGDMLHIQYDSTSSRWRTETDPHILPPARWGLYYYHDMLGTTADTAISSQVNGTSAANSATAVTSVAGHGGIVQHTTGTATTGRAGMLSTNAAGILLGNSWYWRYESMIRIGTLSDGTNRYTYRAGFIDSPSAESTDGIFFRYVDNVNTGQWQLVCRSNGTETATNSTTAPAAATWYRLTIIVNPAGNNAEFFVNGTSIGTCASNLPTGAGRGTGFGSLIIKSAGGTARTIDLDYLEIISYANVSN